MAKLKLLIDDFDEPEYSLIAMHTVLEDYRLAFFINKNLKLKLIRSHNFELKTKTGTFIFRKFVFEDEFNDRKWTLVQNKNEIIAVDKKNETNLFFDNKTETEIKIFLLPEYKNVDYFLKIEHPDNVFETSETIKNISEIYNLSAVYKIDNQNIKSKINLIF